MNTWAQELKESTLERWHSVILVRGEQGLKEMVGWSTSWKDGAYRAQKVEVTPRLSDARELSRDLAWICPPVVASRSGRMDE